ncbi:MAG: PAS domain S-box protein [Caldilineaceae bacterium]|nr:PAS domain S-box protein [Caldilineaceae bacterium]
MMPRLPVTPAPAEPATETAVAWLESAGQLRQVIETAPVAMVALDAQRRAVLWNRAAEQLFGWRAGEVLGKVPPIAPPGRVEEFAALHQRVIEGQPFSNLQTQRLRRDGSLVDVQLSTAPLRDAAGQIVGVMATYLDVTARTQVEQALRQSEERYQIVARVTSDAIWDWNLLTHEVVWSEGLRTVFGYPPETLRHHSWWQEHAAPEDVPRIEASVLAATSSDARFWSDEYRFRRADGSYAHVLDRAHILRDETGRAVRMIGAMVDITERVEAQRMLEQRVAERTRELSTLLEMAHNVAGNLTLDELLSQVLRQLQAVVDYSGAAIYTLDGARLTLLDYRGPGVRERLLANAANLEPGPAQLAVIERHEPVIIPDLWGDSPLARAVQNQLGEQLKAQGLKDTHSWLGVPLLVKERIMGLLVLYHQQPNFYDTRQANLVMAFANHVAVAIENARLFGQAQQLAAVEERQRLARELHDSVSQALYGIALGARTARVQLERDPSKAFAPTDYVLQLAEAGLAEMRALIFELRPESLAQEGLVAALTKQADSLRARHQIEVQTGFGPEPDVALDIKEALYRIAQEATHNIVKHAHASRVDVRLSEEDGALVLEVQDNGRGFDTGADFPGHLGLKSMRERAIRLGGSLTIDSAPGQGSLVRARMPLG